MNITYLLKPFDDFFIYINENKGTLLLILTLLAIYITEFNQYIVENTPYLFDNNLFKLIVFVIISYIASSSPAIGISLTIMMLTSMQIITNLKIKKDFNSEKFSKIEPADTIYLNNEYLTNPLEKQNELSPSIGLDLRLTTPSDYYMQMIKKGKILLDDSYDLEQDLSKRFDVREQQIASITKRNGTELVNSGINRLQKANQGEYNLNLNDIDNNNNNDNNKVNKANKFIKYSKLLENVSNNPNVMASYNDLLYTYNKLVSSQLDEKSFDVQLNKVYLAELDLLETVYKIKKNQIVENKQKIIENEINEIKQLRSENKNWIVNLNTLANLIG